MAGAEDGGSVVPESGEIPATGRRAVQGSGYLLGSQLPIQACLAVYVVLLARWLRPREFGLFAVLWALASVGSATIEQGLARYVTWRIARQPRDVAGLARDSLDLAAVGTLTVSAVT